MKQKTKRRTHKHHKNSPMLMISIVTFSLVILFTLILVISHNNDIKNKKINTQITNPASAYCNRLNYKSYEGYCLFPDGKRCNEWDFFRGKCKQEFTYCEKQGYKIKTVTEDKGTYKIEYAVCIMPDKECPEELFIDNKC